GGCDSAAAGSGRRQRGFRSGRGVSTSHGEEQQERRVIADQTVGRAIHGLHVPTTRAVCATGGRSCPAPTPRREARAGAAPSL
ncbi:unnamed protein product, partial [Ectocarpus sp. 12 AP-2014]